MAEMLRGMGFPGPAFWAVLLVLAELAGGAMLILGLLPRIDAVTIPTGMDSSSRCGGSRPGGSPGGS